MRWFSNSIIKKYQLFCLLHCRGNKTKTIDKQKILFLQNLLIVFIVYEDNNIHIMMINYEIIKRLSDSKLI